MVRPPPVILFPFVPARALDPDRPARGLAWTLLLLLATGTLLYVLEQPGVTDRMLHLLPATAGPADRAAAAAWSGTDVPRRVAFQPFRLCAGWLAFAVVLSQAIVLFRPARRPSFAGVMHAAVLGEGVLLLGGYAALFLDWNPGLADLLPEHAAGARLVLAGATVFGVWQVFGLGALVRVVCGMSGLRACAAVLVAWAVAACGNAAVLVALTDRFHLLP